VIACAGAQLGRFHKLAGVYIGRYAAEKDEKSNQDTTKTCNVEQKGSRLTKLSPRAGALR
jgi:hypothetical protein